MSSLGHHFPDTVSPFKLEVSLAFARNQSGTGKVASNRVLIQMEKGSQAYLNLEWET